MRGLALGDVSVDGSKLTIKLADPETQNAAVIDAIVRAGGRVKTVSIVGSTLEDAYLNLVRDNK